ncbi:MAG: ABC transporter permease [Saprospiraceae bacterium]|nr:ABC transporter permease [Saprospiraceae bacterium]MBK7738498.1 ABC transporter permease [Saprospiraceae bacterium]MBK7912930.1 ABC transporter permease [Saprospiraceae bacterium]
MLIKIARRNIWRSKKRSITLLIAISLGLWSGMFLIAFYNGMIEQRVDAAIRDEISHIQIHHPEFLNDFDTEFVIPDASNTLQSINKNPAVKASAGRVILFGMIASPAGSTGIKINGIQAESENKLTQLSTKLIEGQFFNPLKSNEILIGQKLANKLKLNLNKKTILTFQDTSGNLASAAFRIVGIYKTQNTPFDEANVFVNYADIDSLAGLHGGIHEIAVLLHSNSSLDSCLSEFKQLLPDADVKSWVEISPEIGITVSAGTQMVYIYMGIILLALTFGIINTMMMSVLERTREIGMLLALGMNKFKIFTMILWETCFLILAGCPVGMLLALLTISITHHYGIHLDSYSEVYSNFGYSPIVYPNLNSDQLIKIIIMVIITALVSSILPAQRALKIKPASAIKN